MTDRKHDVVLPASIFRQLDRLRLTASRFLYGKGVGQRPSFRRRPASDFVEHRKYVPGDDPRHIDWKASGRQEHVFVKQGEHPKASTIFILADVSASMAWGDPPKARFLTNLTAVLGYLALAGGDRLAVIPLGAGSAPDYGPISGKAQFPNLIRFLDGLRFEGRLDLVQEARGLREKAGRGGLVLLLSDLLGVENLEAVLDLLPAPKWDVVVLHVLHPDEISPPAYGQIELVDVETGEASNYDVDSAAVEAYRARMARWRENLELSCINHHAFYTLLPTGWDLEHETVPHLRAVQIVSVK